MFKQNHLNSSVLPDLKIPAFAGMTKISLGELHRQSGGLGWGQIQKILVPPESFLSCLNINHLNSSALPDLKIPAFAGMTKISLGELHRQSGGWGGVKFMVSINEILPSSHSVSLRHALASLTQDGGIIQTISVSAGFRRRRIRNQ